MKGPNRCAFENDREDDCPFIVVSLSCYGPVYCVLHTTQYGVPITQICHILEGLNSC